jgi:drug/metabolite transporter (DMT)-like permease
MRQYLKFAAQVVFTIIAALVAALVDERIDTVEWINAGIMALGAVSVLGAGNLPAGVWAYTKTIVAAATAALVALVTLAVAGVLGVAALPGPKVYDAAAAGRAAANLRNGPA